MASSSLSLFFFVFSLLGFAAFTTNALTPMVLTVVNNCPFTIWPALQPNAGHFLLERGGFTLETLHHRTFPVPDRHWSGRIWARTGCTFNPSSGLSCLTGACGNRLECGGLGGAVPSTLAQLSLHHPGTPDLASYSVSLVDGFNLPMTVTPHEGKGTCPVVGCKENLLATCPEQLKVRATSGAGVVACKSGCEAFGTDELCCRNRFNSANVCRGSSWSEFFKHACPATFTYAHDTPSLTHECSSPKEMKIIFCH